MTKTCAYCGTEVTEQENMVSNSNPYCDFCEMELDPENEVMNDGMRNLKKIPPVTDASFIGKSTEELKQLSTFELFSLLKEVKRERSGMYENHVNTRKMRDEADKTDLATLELIENNMAAIFEMYEYYTKKNWVIENILLKRVDHIPARLTDVFLHKFWENSQKTNARMKPMTIRKEQQKTY